MAKTDGYCSTCQHLVDPDPERFPPAERPNPPKCLAGFMDHERVLTPGQDDPCGGWIKKK